MDYRHEIKHRITQADAVALRQNLSAVASIDAHAQKEDCYRIRRRFFRTRERQP